MGVHSLHADAEVASSQPFTFYNIAPFSPGEEKLLAEEMIEYYQRTGNDLVLYSLTLHPQGYPAKKKADYLIASYRKLKHELKGSGVRLGVLLQSVIGHWPRMDEKEEDWTRTVNIRGEAVRFCPLDDRFRNYIRETVVSLAKEGPSFIMSDDDVRSFSPHAECFCPLHTAEFNRRFGSHFTPEEYRENVQSSKVGDKVYVTYCRLCRDTVNGVASLIREAIDSVDPRIPAGSCMPGNEYRFNGDTARCIAGKHKPVMRLCNTNYCEGSPKDFPEIMIRTQAIRAFHKDIPQVLDEADTCPHNLYSRAAISMHAKLCASIMSGLNGAKVWYVNAHKNGFPISRNYTDILAEHRQFYQRLAQEVRESRPVGIIIPGLKHFPNWHPVHNPNEHFVEPYSFANVLGSYGIPFQCSFDYRPTGTYVIDGDATARRLSDEEIKLLLSHAVFIDGPAAMVLTERGFADLMGVRAERKPFCFTEEKDVRTGHFLPTDSGPKVPFLTDRKPETEVLSTLHYAPFYKSPDSREVAPGTVLYRNRLGGTVCTSTFYNGIWDYSAARKAWLLRILNDLDCASVPVAVLNEQTITVLARRGKDGSLLTAIFNINFEPVRTLKLLLHEHPKEVLRMTAAGHWEKTDFIWQDGKVLLGQELPCYGTLALKCRF